jgi:S-adenosylmethionine hydrolase
MPTVFTRPVTTPATERRLARPRSTAPLVSLTTDFGARDPSAAICRGVILQIAPGVTVLDISHDVEKYAILDGALLLWCALPYLPVGVHVAVIDPGVGTERLPVGVEVARGDILVGPDNGLLRPAAERLGGIRRVHLLENPDYRLTTVSASFHGRDIFAPAAAHLALGVSLADFGRALDPGSLVQLELPAPVVLPGTLETEVVYVDTFGNVKLAGEEADLEAAVGHVTPGDRLAARVHDHPTAPRSEELRWATTFGDVRHGEQILYVDSYGRLCIAVNQGSAAASLRLGAPCRISLERAG